MSRGKDGSRAYQGDSEKCNECPYKSRCCQSKKGEARTINKDDKETAAPANEQKKWKQGNQKSFTNNAK